MAIGYSSDDVVPVGSLIRQSRGTAGLTQRQLAHAAGVSVGTLRDIEQGRTLHPRPGTLEDLARVLRADSSQRAELLRYWRACAGARRVGVVHRRSGGKRARPSVRVEVLGPLTATRLGKRLALGSVRQRAVLGLLVLHEDRWLHRDVLIDVLWGEHAPPRAVAKVQGYVSSLRGLLDPVYDGGKRVGLLACAGHGYQFNAHEADVDLLAFSHWVERADSAAAQRDPARACEHYERALAVWRGDALADIDLLREHPAVTWLASRRADVVLRYAEAAALIYRSGQVLPHLRDLCARETFNEPAHGSLMIALADVGPQAAAIGVFTALRQRLDRELGIRPGPALMQAHIRVLRHQFSPVLR